MTFQPVIPVGGLAGWGFLNRTMQAQTTAFQKSPTLVRDTEYFAQNIGDVKSADQLVSDRRLLRVALGAFGLSDDINNTHFVRKILGDGTIDPYALSNRLADTRYKAFSKAFGFGDFDTARTQLSDFAKEITNLYQTRQFEEAVGVQDSDLRLALNAKRELGSISSGTGSDNTKWFTIMGSAPLRSVFETAFGLPSSFGKLDIDKQLVVFQHKSEKIFGSSAVSNFSDHTAQEALVERYLLMSQISNSASASSAEIALTLLR